MAGAGKRRSDPEHKNNKKEKRIIMTKVGILMGSDSDLPVMQKADRKSVV